MHYSSLSPDRLVWSRSKNGAKAYYGAGKFMFQTPIFTTHMKPVWKIPGAVELCTNIAEFDEYPEFISFLSRLEQEAALHMMPPPVLPTFSMRKMTAFSTTHFFDANNRYIEDPEEQLSGNYKIVAILQCTGAWMTANAWGLKFKIEQIKILDKSPQEKIAVPSLFISGPGDELSIKNTAVFASRGENTVPLKPSLFISGPGDDEIL